MPILKRLAGEFEPFAKRLLRLKQARGLSSADIARAAEVTPTAVWNWENGNTEPRYLTLVKVAEALGVTPEQLEYGDRPPAERRGAGEEDEVLTIAQVVEEARHQISRALGVEPKSVKLLIQLSV